MDELKGETDKKLARKFADEYLRDDGCFVLRLVSKNSSDILLADLILELWSIFKSKPALKGILADEDYLNESPAWKMNTPNYHTVFELRSKPLWDYKIKLTPIFQLINVQRNGHASYWPHILNIKHVHKN